MVLAYYLSGVAREVAGVGSGATAIVCFWRYRLVARIGRYRRMLKAVFGCLMPILMRTQMVIRMASMSAVAVGLLRVPFPMWVP